MGFFRWTAPASNRWSDEGIDEICRQLEPFLTERRAILDLGGGNGFLAARLAHGLAANLTILDLEVGQRTTRQARVRAVQGHAEQMPFPDASFDAVVISNALHHFADQERAARQIVRVLRPGGGLLVLEFSPQGFMRVNVWVERLLGAPGRFFGPDELVTYLGKRGISGSWFATSRISYCFVGTAGRVDAASDT